MRINTNVQALNSYRQLTISQSHLSKNMEKLSSGYRINRAGDDAAGLAISEKMRSQIRGLSMAERNTQDAVSLIQTAEGALQEMDNCLQRMRELTIQAANGTLEDKDRQAVQDEIDQLTYDIDRIAKTTQFNANSLLRGSLKGRSVITTNSPVMKYDGSGTWKGTLTSDATSKAEIKFTLPDAGDDGQIYKINGKYYEIDNNNAVIGQNVKVSRGSKAEETLMNLKNAIMKNDPTFDKDASIVTGNTMLLKSAKSLTPKEAAEITIETPSELSAASIEVSLGYDFGAMVKATVDGKTIEINDIIYEFSSDGIPAVAGNRVVDISYWQDTGVDDARAKYNVDKALEALLAKVIASDPTFDLTNSRVTKAVNNVMGNAAFDSSGKLTLGTGGFIRATTPTTAATAAAAQTGAGAGDTLSFNAGLANGTAANGLNIVISNTPNTSDSVAASYNSATKTITVNLASTTLTNNNDDDIQAAIRSIAAADGIDFSLITVTGAGTYATAGAGQLAAAVPAGGVTFALAGGAEGAVAGDASFIVANTANTSSVTGLSINAAKNSKAAMSSAYEAIYSKNIYLNFVEVPKQGDKIIIDGTTIIFDEKKSVQYSKVTDSATINVSDMTLDEILKELESIITSAQNEGNANSLESVVANGSSLILTTNKTDDGNNTNSGNGLSISYVDNDFETYAGDNLEMMMQVGANESETMLLEIGTVDSAFLGLARKADHKERITTAGIDAEAGVSVLNQEDANNAITIFDNAIRMVSESRSRLGAYQNRLEHTINNLQTNNENLTAAESRIRDTDMALEMSEYTKNNIINQAATAMLAQANQLPQGILQLLK